MKRLLWKIEWNEGMSVGIPEIDADHKQFIVLITELNHLISERVRPAEIHNQLELIIEDAKRHFAREEQFFAQWEYPAAAEHARVHASILKSLHKIIDSFMPYGLDAEWLDAAIAFKERLISHILVEDMKYAHYLQIKEGGSASPYDPAASSNPGKHHK
jgi:hemerythrin-like metal-binding protein